MKEHLLCRELSKYNYMYIDTVCFFKNFFTLLFLEIGGCWESMKERLICRELSKYNYMYIRYCLLFFAFLLYFSWK